MWFSHVIFGRTLDCAEGEANFSAALENEFRAA
jgi:hypothetical protein